ncbi:unnamed protein product, partial [Effrenium voratum]
MNASPVPFASTAHGSPGASPTKSVFGATTQSAPSKLMDGQLTLLRKTLRDRRGSTRQSGLSPLPPSPPRTPSGLNRGTSCPPQSKTRAASVGSGMGRSTSAHPGGETPKGSPVPKRRCEALATSPRSRNPPRGERGRELPKFALGGKVPGFLLQRVAAFLPVQALPSLRRVSGGFYRAIHLRLTEDPGLMTALVANLEARRLKSKRVWVLVRARPCDAISCIAIDRNKVSVSNATGAPASFFFDQA